MISDLVSWLEDSKAKNIKYYDVNKILSYTDKIIVCTAENSIHAKAIAQKVIENFINADIDIYNKEGFGTNWILLDYSDFIVHIFLEKTRKYYDLENLWYKLK